MNPAATFYATKIFHARLRPFPHRFSYRALSLVIDLDRLEEAGRVSPFFSVGRFNVFGFRQSDYGARQQSGLRAHIGSVLMKAGAAAPPASILLQTFPLLFGKGFSPLSIYFCLGEARDLRYLVYEVRNTFGERHSYVAEARAAAGGACEPHQSDKLFYVSPFMDMALRYRFLTQVPDQRLSAKIIARDRGGTVLTAMMSGKAVSPASLLLHAIASPLFGTKVLAGIHWQALRLWLKGHHIRARLPHRGDASISEPGEYSLRSGDTPGARRE